MLEVAREGAGVERDAKRALETRVQELQAENGRLTVKVASAARVDAAATTHARAAKKHRKRHKHA